MLHLGCGPIHFPNVNGSVEWINIDKEPSSACDICEDYLHLARLYKQSTIDGIYTCHSIEHLDYPAGVVQFFTQAFYVLQPGGTLRVVVPDLFKGIRAYIGSRDGFDDIFQIYSPRDGRWFYHKAESHAERFHFFMTAWEHRMVFDFQLLEMLMKDAGFAQIRRMEFGVSRLVELTDLDRFMTESICVECVKP